ncbi:hypothetical protein TSOC_004907 [Tetrabaena socialis]|uniref:EGF-like domain-containing protein n=1 Tax=Tetrabaena socialis TaxID=47790 RepID=A0A2J8A7M0_9CHLO|nr:hypothetical protein TSOC_004907 [Tetrabaena socialis]|eukprot:PNH08532.1 hypothetical protein TSOC_004907 [Tetrabaena socialis]
MVEASFHLALLLGSNSADASITLSGLLTNFTATTDPATSTAVTVPQAYPDEAATYSFALHTTHDAPSAQLQFSRRQLGYGAYTGMQWPLSTSRSLADPALAALGLRDPPAGMYLCANSTASTTLTLRGATNSCPLSLLPNGQQQLCSGRGTTDTCPHGTCTCPQPYTPPPNWVMTPGLGFEDCSATLQPLLPGPSGALTAKALPGAWSFFSLVVPGAGVAEVAVSAVAVEAAQGSLALFLRHQQLPAEGEGQYDVGGDSSSWLRDQSAHVTLRRGDAAFQPDCSVSLYPLTLGQPLTAAPRAFTYDTLVLRDARQQLPSAATSRLTLTASFTTSDPADPPGLPAWVAARPVVLVAPSAEAAANASGGGGVLWPDGAAARMALTARGAQYTMDVGPWMIAADNALHVLFFNPLSAPRAVGYTLTLAVAGTCLADCSGHGACDAATGLCKCQAPFAGGDCSVDLSAFNGTACAAGSLRPVHLPDRRGTCWAGCKPDGSGFDDSGACAEFTCDGPGEGHGQLRRKGAEDECVEDACTAGDHTVTDPSGDFACTRRCLCPEGGGACGMEATCEPGTLQCLRGLRLVADPERCVAPPACEQGSLKRAYELEGGSAFALCACAAAGDAASCAFTGPTQAASNAGGVVSCLPGYERQGSTSAVRLSDGSEVVTGGACVQAGHETRRHGVSGGMVFFYCLLSIALAAGCVYGSKYGLLMYEQYRYGRSVFSQGQLTWPLFGNRANAGGGADDW